MRKTFVIILKIRPGFLLKAFLLKTVLVGVFLDELLNHRSENTTMNIYIKNLVFQDGDFHLLKKTRNKPKNDKARLMKMFGGK